MVEGPEIELANSKNSFSTVSDGMDPSDAITTDSSRISSSSNSDMILETCSSVRDIIKIAAFCGPVRL